MKSRWWLVASGLGLSCAIAFAFWSSGPNPDDRAAEYVSYFRSHNWGAIYDMASQEEKDQQPWKRDQFVKLMSSIGSGLPNAMPEVNVQGSWDNQTSFKRFTLTFICAMEWPTADISSSKQMISVPFYRDYEDWHPRIFDLPLFVVRMGKRPEVDQIDHMIQACKEAGVKALIRFDDKMVYDLPRLAQFRAGKLDAQKVFHHSGL